MVKACGVVQTTVVFAEVKRLALFTDVVFGTRALVFSRSFVEGDARAAVVARRGRAHAREFAARAVERVLARAAKGVDVISARAAVVTRRADAIVDVDVTMQPCPSRLARAGVVSVLEGVARQGGVFSAGALLARFELRLAKVPGPARRARTGVEHVPVYARAVVSALVGVAVVHAPPTPLPLSLPPLQAWTREGVPVILAVRAGRARVDVTHGVSLATGVKVAGGHCHALWRRLTLSQGHADLVEGQIPHAALKVAHQVTFITCRKKNKKYIYLFFYYFFYGYLLIIFIHYYR